MLQDNKVASTKSRSHAVAQGPGPAAIAQPFVAPVLQLKAGMEKPDREALPEKAFAPLQAKTLEQSGSKVAVTPFQLAKANTTMTAHSAANTAWHSVQQQKGKVPAIQQKKEAEDTVQKKSDNNSVIQRKVLIQGAPVENLLDQDEELPQEVFLKAGDWLTDQYKRNYQSLEEFYAHASGDPVQVGLIPTLALWYRLPLPSQHALLASEFFLLGELHHIFPLRLLVEESNQHNAKAITESGAAFGNQPLAPAGGPNLDLPRAVKPNTYLAELGLAKALFAFAEQYEPQGNNAKLIREDISVTRHEIGNPANPVARPTRMENWDNVADWDDMAKTIQPADRHRHIDGRPYFIIRNQDGSITGHVRGNISTANKYKQGNATNSFLDKPEIIAALPDAGLVNDYLNIRRRGRYGFGNYEAVYKRVFAALRQASVGNLGTVYPNHPAGGVTRANPQTKPGSPHQGRMTDLELSMNHRNTAMVGALEHANQQGGYDLASFGDQHVLDIKAHYARAGAAPFTIITYNEFVGRQQYAL